MTSRVDLAREHVDCPIEATQHRGCGAVAGSPCVYLGPPEHMRTWPSQQLTVRREGTPMTGVHAARSANYWLWEQRRRVRRAVPLAPLDLAARIAHAERDHDRREAAKLASWLRAGGAALLLSAVELPTVPADLDGGECPECDSSVELLMSGVRCTSCAWWYCA